jgi:nucleotide-binding universal stress UspA family protein
MHLPGKIIAALAFGDHSEGVFNYAIMLAKAFNADVVLANIINDRDVEAVRSISSMGYEVDGEHYVSSIRKDRERMSEQFIIDSGFPADRVRIVIRTGNPFSELIKICKDEGADMIVMGPKGRTSLKNVLVGSVAEKIYQHSPITIVSYRKKSNAS